MELVVGAVLEGKVTGITKFGAFVALDGFSKSGLVHISEVANTYVNDIKDHLSDGQQVKVKVISIDENGRINLSIKKAAEPRFTPVRQNQQSASRHAQADLPPSFEDKLKQFMADSDSKIGGLYSEHRTSRRKK